MQSKEQLKEKFNQIILRKNSEGIRMTKELSQLLSFMEYSINKDLQSFNLFSFAICGAGSRKFQIRKQLQNSFSSCYLYEKIEYFGALIKYLVERNIQTSIKVVESDWPFEELEINLIKGVKLSNKSVKIWLKKLSLDCSHFDIDLSTYLLRKSKKDKDVYCFETIIDQEPSTIRFEVPNNSKVKEDTLMMLGNCVLRQLADTMNALQQRTKQEIRLLKKSNHSDGQIVPVQSEVVLNMLTEENRTVQTIPLTIQIPNNSMDNKSLFEELVANQPEDNTNEEIYDYLERKVEEAKKFYDQQKQGKKHTNRLPILLPRNFSLASLNAFGDYSPELRIKNERLQIYYSKKHNSFKLQLTLKCGKQKLLEHLCQVQNEKLWNKAVNESQVKWAITSQNAYIFYKKHKSVGEWFRERDFLFIRYLFKQDDSYFIVDRSIQNPHFIPFQSIQRGAIEHCIIKIQQSAEGVVLLMDLKMEHEGLLTSDQKKALTLSYLQQYANLESFIQNFNGIRGNKFDFDWQVEETNENLNNFSSVSISSEVFNETMEGLRYNTEHQEDDDEESFYSIIDEPIQFEISPEEMKSKQRFEVKELRDEQIVQNADGLVVLPHDYIKIKHPVKPIDGPERRRKMDYDHIMLKKDFEIAQQGGIVLTNQTKIAAQNNVISFVMSTMKKNLFSGKGILNISLPVQIFNVDSNIQRLCQSMGMGPDLLERKAVLAQTPLERFKYCISFALSNSVLYFDIDKPFNPILGETYQGFIDGCPIYAEQISHHPPISSILFIGRGYRVYTNIEAKVYIHLNSGEGVNQGLYTIQFDNGDKVLFQTAPGEVTGLAVGDRKYRIKGKMVVLDPKNHLCSVVNFEDESGIFSSNKWKYSDQIEGKIWEVAPGYVRNFFTSEKRKEVSKPTKKEILGELGVIDGRWVDKMMIDGMGYYDISKIPHEMAHYQYPLNSNSNYRQDLLYRKKDDIARSQIEKERLEILQRGDRKFREKYHGKGH